MKATLPPKQAAIYSSAATGMIGGLIPIQIVTGANRSLTSWLPLHRAGLPVLPYRNCSILLTNSLSDGRRSMLIPDSTLPKDCVEARLFSVVIPAFYRAAMICEPRTNGRHLITARPMSLLKRVSLQQPHPLHNGATTGVKWPHVTENRISPAVKRKLARHVVSHS